MRTQFWLETLNGRDHRRPKYRWEDSIKMNLMELGLKDVDWIHLTQN